MSKSLSKHSNMRKSGNSLVVTVPVEIVREMDLSDGDSTWWTVDEINGKKFLSLHITKLEDIAPEGHLKMDEEFEEEA